MTDAKQTGRTEGGDLVEDEAGQEIPTGTGLTQGDERTGPGADAGVTSSSRATATNANLAETEATGPRGDGPGQG